MFIYIIGMENIITIYSYTDYRKFLQDFYEFEKDNSKLSYRTMSKLMGFTSPNYLKLVIDGSRHIGRSSIAKVAEGLKLKKREREYFSYLVFFAKAKVDTEKNFYFGKIVSMRSSRNIKTLDDSMLTYYKDWYNPVIREFIVGEVATSLDHSKIARLMIPHIHHKQVSSSIKTLLELGLVFIDEDGVYRQKDRVVNSANELSTIAVKEFHRKMIEFGGDSIDNFAKEIREVSSVTVKISDEGFKKIKKRVQNFREEILQLVHDDCEVDRVYQLNFQLFPLSSMGENND